MRYIFIISDLIIYKLIKKGLITMKIDSWSDT